MQDQRQIRTTHSAFETFDYSSAAIERQSDCGPVAAASEHISAAPVESAAVLATNKSTSNTAPAHDSDEGDLQGHKEWSSGLDYGLRAVRAGILGGKNARGWTKKGGI